MRESIGWPGFLIVQVGGLFLQAWFLMLAVGIFFSNGVLDRTIGYGEALWGAMLVDLVVSVSIAQREVKP